MRIATFLALLMLTSITLCGPVLAAPPAQGDTVTISTPESWTDGTFDGEIVIKDGGTLHWSGDIMIEQDARIIVEEEVPFILMVPTLSQKMQHRHSSSTMERRLQSMKTSQTQQQP